MLDLLVRIPRRKFNEKCTWCLTLITNILYILTFNTKETNSTQYYSFEE